MREGRDPKDLPAVHMGLGFPAQSFLLHSEGSLRDSKAYPKGLRFWGLANLAQMSVPEFSSYVALESLCRLSEPGFLSKWRFSTNDTKRVKYPERMMSEKIQAEN